VFIEQVRVDGTTIRKDIIRSVSSYPMKTYLEGSSITITMVISKPTATCTFTIDDPSETVKVDAAAMTKQADYIYTYTYQSSESNEYGPWVITLKATYDSYTAVTQDRVTFLEHE